jgi:hypothetical protein
MVLGDGTNHIQKPRSPIDIPDLIYDNIGLYTDYTPFCHIITPTGRRMNPGRGGSSGSGTWGFLGGGRSRVIIRRRLKGL